MQTLGIVAILSAAFLIALWLLWKGLRGGAGPVIIITPPPDMLAVTKVTGWGLKDRGGSPVTIQWYPNLNGLIPADLLQEIVRVTVVLRANSPKPKPLAFSRLKLQLASGDTITMDRNGSRLNWANALGGNWVSSGGALNEWPEMLRDPVSLLEFVDGNGVSYGFDDISSITFQLSKLP